MPESAIGLDTPRYSNVYFFNANYLLFFHQGVNLYSFIPEVARSFLKILKYDLYIEIGILIG